jgi:ABC-type uncharacterized transport system permease subunit
MMAILNQLSLFGLAGFCYLALGAHFWRTRWTEEGPWGAPVGPHAPRWEKLAIGVTLFLHASGLKLALFDGDGMRFSFSLAFSLMIWLAVLIYWLENFRARMDSLQPLVLAAGVLAAFLPLVFAQTRPIADAGAFGFRLHFLAAMTAYSLFTLAAFHAIFMRLIEKRLHQHLVSRRMANMPPVLALESLLFRILTIAFALLTLALGSGLLYSGSLYGNGLPFKHKIIFAILSWIIFAVLLCGRYIYGWRGRKALNWTLAGFVVLLLAYVGSHFVLEVLLRRS